MREVQPNELQAGQVYYIESRFEFIGTISPDYVPKTQKQKGVFENSLSRIAHEIYYVNFNDVENIRKNDYSGPGRTGEVGYPTDLYKFYLPEKETIELNVANRILQSITNDPRFAYYLDSDASI
jgi:hypothetical protein